MDSLVMTLTSVLRILRAVMKMPTVLTHQAVSFAAAYLAMREMESTAVQMLMNVRRKLTDVGKFVTTPKEVSSAAV
jgi:hypothetical protein